VLVRNNIFVSIGIGAMVVVVYAILASLTLLPAFLGIIGKGVNWLRVPYLGRAGYGTKFWTAVTHKVQKHPVVSVVLTAGLLIIAALPLTTIELGSNGNETLPKKTATYQGIKALERDFSAGRTDPIDIVVEGAIGSPPVQDGV